MLLNEKEQTAPKPGEEGPRKRKIPEETEKQNLRSGNNVAKNKCK